MKISLLDLMNLTQPWVLAAFPSFIFVRLLIKKPRTIKVGEGIGEDEFAYLYWAGLVASGLWALASWALAILGAIES